MPQKIRGTFDKFPTVSCNGCSRYWDSSCDGVSVGDQKDCRSFIATRDEDFPKQLRDLRNIIVVQGVAIVLISLALILHFFTG